MLRYTKVKLKVITDIDMYLMIEKGIRGGVSMITHKYAKANNGSYYKRDEHTSYIIYWDANNLYGWAMSQYLPTVGFHWVSDEELLTLNVRDIAEDAENGYILEVYLEYPDTLHDDHSDYPLPPERRTINKKQLSPYSQQLIDELGMESKPTEKSTRQDQLRAALLQLKTVHVVRSQVDEDSSRHWLPSKQVASTLHRLQHGNAESC